MNETRRSKKQKRRIKIGLSVVLVIMVAVVGYLYKAYSDIGNTAKSIYNQVDIDQKREESVDVEEATHPISFLLLGVDTGTAEEERTETGRSDTVIVCTVNPNTRTTTLLSIPRDTYTEIVGYGEEYDYVGDYYDKVNHAYAYGGTEMSINSVQNFLDIPIDYYVEVNFDGLVDIVDAVGGIEITSPLTFDFYGPQFIEGETRIFTGYEALQFSRMRKQDPEGDLGRQKRQQMVIKAILSKVLSMGTVVNYKDLLESVEDNTQTNLTLDEIISIASGYRKSMETFQQYTIAGEEMYINEIYYYYVNPEERLRLSNLLRAELELSEIALEDLPISSDEPYYEEGYQGTDSSYSDPSLYGSDEEESGTSTYYDDTTSQVESYYDDTYSEEEVYDPAVTDDYTTDGQYPGDVYDSSY